MGIGMGKRTVTRGRTTAIRSAEGRAAAETNRVRRDLIVAQMRAQAQRKAGQP